jgi:DNA-binding MarR family transcriptional regulator
MQAHEHCPTCGQKFRQYKQRAYPTRDKVVAILKDQGPKTNHELAEMIGLKPWSLSRLLRVYEEQGYLQRMGFEERTREQTYTRTLSKRRNTATLRVYRTRWDVADAHRD